MYPGASRLGGASRAIRRALLLLPLVAALPPPAAVPLPIFLVRVLELDESGPVDDAPIPEYAACVVAVVAVPAWLTPLVSDLPAWLPIDLARETGETGPPEEEGEVVEVGEAAALGRRGDLPIPDTTRWYSGPAAVGVVPSGVSGRMIGAGCRLCLLM